MNLPLDNQTLLTELKRRLDVRELDRADVERVLVPESVSGAEKSGFSFSFTKLLYILGGVIVSLGIIFFVGQIWEDIGAFGRVLVTLGIGLALAWSGTHFMRTEPEKMLGDVLHAVGGIVLPSGALVLLDELFGSIDTVWSVIGIFTAVTVLYLLLLRLFQRSILVFYAIANGTIALILTFTELFPRADEQVYLLFAMTIGVVYVYLAYAFKDRWNHYLLGLLNIAGGATFYIAAFLSIFEGQIFWSSGHSVFWELVFPVLAIAGMAGSIHMRSRSLLLITTLALIGYIVYLTSEYFADSIGWPLALVILGFVIIGVGYTSVNLSKKYIR